MIGKYVASTLDQHREDDVIAAYWLSDTAEEAAKSLLEYCEYYDYHCVGDSIHVYQITSVEEEESTGCALSVDGPFFINRHRCEVVGVATFYTITTLVRDDETSA